MENNNQEKPTNVHCCENCEFLRFQGAQWDQPYPEIYCDKGHGDISSHAQLQEENECKDFVQTKIQSNEK